jgi:hypothetical protein
MAYMCPPKREAGNQKGLERASVLPQQDKNK